jgi:hypothetical protein
VEKRILLGAVFVSVAYLAFGVVEALQVFFLMGAVAAWPFVSRQVLDLLGGRPRGRKG